MTIASQPAPGERYSVLRPLSISEQQHLAISIATFFSPISYQSMLQSLGLPDTPGQLRPFSLLQFFSWTEKTSGMEHIPRLRPHVIQLISKMVDAGFLSHEGKSSPGALAEANCYFFVPEFTKIAAKGYLWLGGALGEGYIAHEISKALVRITGEADGVPSVGTGLHILPQYVVTCDHVLRDMKVDKTVLVNGESIVVDKVYLQKEDHPIIDVAVLRLASPQPLAQPSLAFREAILLERIVTAGYPKIPFATEGDAVFHSGEVCQVNVKTYIKATFDLFSAIARPGNSGGPLVTMDGKIIGLVTKSLERQIEQIDPMITLPFFASVPAHDVRQVFQQLTGEELPWENYA